MKKIIVFLMFSSISLSYARPINKLEDITFQQGELVNTITFLFEQTPSAIYEPDVKTHTSFFLPFTDFNNASVQRIKEQLQQSKNQGFTVAVEPVVKPVQGLRIVLAYDPVKIGWEYSPLDGMSEEKGLVFKIYNKQKLKAIGERTNKLRWQAFATRLPQYYVLC